MTLDWNAASKLEAAYVRFPTANKPEVAAVALRLPLNTPDVSTLLKELNVRLVSVERATPEPPFTGENVKKCVAFVLADTVFTF